MNMWSRPAVSKTGEGRNIFGEGVTKLCICTTRHATKARGGECVCLCMLERATVIV